MFDRERENESGIDVLGLLTGMIAGGLLGIAVALVVSMVRHGGEW